MRSLRFSLALIGAGLCFTFVACSGGSSTPPTQQQTGQTLQNGASALENPYRRTPPRPPVPTHTVTATDRAASIAAGWQQVKAAAPFGAAGAVFPLLMTDGTVMIQDSGSNWYSLTPDVKGSYADGKWTQRASLPSGYGPLYYASAVLADGRLIINGGEYNFGATADSNQGAIYNPFKNTWTSVAPPAGWSSIGDGQSAVLANGTYMIGNCCGITQAQYDETTGTWTIVGAGKGSVNAEEGWTLLPSGDLLSVDVSNAPGVELFSPATNTWSPGPPTPINLTQAGGKFLGEIGPQVLRYNGTVFVVGANGYTVVYNLASGKWSIGPKFPVAGGVQLDVADGPAALLVNGNVLVPASPGVFKTPATYFIYNGTMLTKITGPPNAINDSTYNIRLLVLPNGHVLETDGSDDVEIYTPVATQDSSIAPMIKTVPATLTHGKTYAISGYRFNGNSQANAYGDDAQEATNYPLVQIMNRATGHVFFARTHNHSSMAVGSPAEVSTEFDVPTSIERGASQVFVIANGIKSTAASVTIN